MFPCIQLSSDDVLKDEVISLRFKLRLQEKEMERKKEDYRRVAGELTKLQRRQEELQTEKKELQTEKKELQTEKKELQTEKTQLALKNEELNEKLISVQESIVSHPHITLHYVVHSSCTAFYTPHYIVHSSLHCTLLTTLYTPH